MLETSNPFGPSQMTGRDIRFHLHEHMVGCGYPQKTVWLADSLTVTECEVLFKRFGDDITKLAEALRHDPDSCATDDGPEGCDSDLLEENYIDGCIAEAVECGQWRV